jgi:hypothetical protein
MPGLADGERGQQPPQAIPIGEVREPPGLGLPAETVERTESHILLVGPEARSVVQTLAGQGDQALEILLPERAYRRRNPRIEAGRARA